MNLDTMMLSKDGHIATITINRPPANVWNLAAMEDLKVVLDDVENDSNIRVVILTGAGEKCFSAGFDVSDAANVKEIAAKGRVLWRRIDRFTKPFIAVLNGHALGGGLELAMCCHFRIMVDSEKAKIGLTELNLGIIPGWGGTQRLMNIVGKAKALDMILFGNRITAPVALEIGLVNQIATPETLMEKSLEFAEKLSLRPPIAVSAVLKSMDAGIYEGMDAGLDMEASMTDKVSETKDAIEGFTAFLEKRPPLFKGE
ncbi:MAG: enoyl-CoA hydratase [Desulfobacterales bacterium]|nr:enoyl-CoA hydratase [Desulfobacterales bacterium]MCP4159118.1 enoyl-CoA hydratase [Deltaproteobacteria bacterium]